MDAAEVVGRLVGKALPNDPRTARGLLELAYTYVGLTGPWHLADDAVSQATHRLTADVAKTIVASLRHPERACVVNVFLPCELLHALGVVPMFPEGISVYVASTRCPEVFCEAAERIGIPESFCSYHKLMLGMAETGVLPAPALVANTTLACDANQVSFRRLAEQGPSPHVVIDVPQAVDEDAVAYVVDQLAELATTLQDVFSRALDPTVLEDSCARSLATLQAMRAFVASRAKVSVPMSLTGELCQLMATHIMLGSRQAERFARSIVAASSKARPARGEPVPRIYWMHTLPNWQRSMMGVFDGARRAELVGNDMAYDALDVIDELDPRRPLEFMARRLVHSSANGPATRRLDAALRQARTVGADGVIIFGHWGCKQTQGLSAMGKRLFEEAGLPTLVLDGDGCDPRNAPDGQMVTRVDAFLEQLQGRLASPISGAYR